MMIISFYTIITYNYPHFINYLYCWVLFVNNDLTVFALCKMLILTIGTDHVLFLASRYFQDDVIVIADI